MNKIGQYVTTLAIGAFAIVLVALVVMTAGRAANPIKGSLTAALEKISAQNLHATALAPADVYGEDWVAAAILCPGYGPEEVQQLLQVNAADLGIDGEIPDSENYLAVINQQGQAYAEKLDRSTVDLCSAQVPGGFDARSMVPFVKTDAGVWTLAAG